MTLWYLLLKQFKPPNPTALRPPRSSSTLDPTLIKSACGVFLPPLSFLTTPHLSLGHELGAGPRGEEGQDFFVFWDGERQGSLMASRPDTSESTLVK